MLTLSTYYRVFVCASVMIAVRRSQAQMHNVFFTRLEVSAQNHTYMLSMCMR
jgi:hypothetical protein